MGKAKLLKTSKKLTSEAEEKKNHYVQRSKEKSEHRNLISKEQVGRV